MADKKQQIKLLTASSRDLGKDIKAGIRERDKFNRAIDKAQNRKDKIDGKLAKLTAIPLTTTEVNE